MIEKLMRRSRAEAAAPSGTPRWKPPRRGGAARRFVAVDFDSRGVRLVQAERAGAGIRIVRVLARPALAEPRLMT